MQDVQYGGFVINVQEVVSVGDGQRGAKARVGEHYNRMGCVRLVLVSMPGGCILGRL